jgi:hypothetical protein
LDIGDSRGAEVPHKRSPSTDIATRPERAWRGQQEGDEDSRAPQQGVASPHQLNHRSTR